MVKHFFIVVLVVSGLAFSARAAELRILTENIEPFNYIENDQWKGTSAEIVLEITHRLGIPSAIEGVPWARGYQLALSTPNIVLFSMARTPEREHRFHWVGPVGLFRSAFYARSGSGIVIQSIDEARAVSRIGTYKQDVREDYLLENGFQNIDSTNSNESNLRKLLTERIDLWATSTNEAVSTAERMGIDPSAIERVYTFQTFFMYIGISKSTPFQIAAAWQKSLDAMKADGTFLSIWQKYLPDESLPDEVLRPSSDQGGEGAISVLTENSPPGNYVEEGRLKGPAVQVVQEILRRLALNTTIEVVPWARGYHLARSQPNVALFSTSRLPQRETLFKWVGPLYTQRWGFYGRRDAAPDIARMEDARAVARIGTYREDAKEQYLKSIGFQNLVSTNNNMGNVRHLMEGSIDLWVSSDFNMPYIVRYAGHDPGQLRLVLSFKTVGNYIAFSPATPDRIVMRWQETLDAIRSDGTWARYFGKTKAAVE